MQSLLFCLEQVALGYPGTLVLDQLDWSVYRGERWAIVGPNGAGKTTLMKTLLGLIDPLAGQINYYTPSGEPTSARPSIGYLPQINQIDRSFPISAGEVVTSGLWHSGLDRKAERTRTAELLRAIGLSDYATSPIGQLSGGQLQRILLARALASRPELTILDEPTSFLDKAYKRQFLELIDRLTPEGSTILMVTHEISEEDMEQWQTLPIGRW